MATQTVNFPNNLSNLSSIGSCNNIAAQFGEQTSKSTPTTAVGASDNCSSPNTPSNQNEIDEKHCSSSNNNYNDSNSTNNNDNNNNNSRKSGDADASIEMRGIAEQQSLLQMHMSSESQTSQNFGTELVSIPRKMHESECFEFNEPLPSSGEIATDEAVTLPAAIATPSIVTSQETETISRESHQSTDEADVTKSVVGTDGINGPANDTCL